jgi:hypothetical protein
LRWRSGRILLVVTVCVAFAVSARSAEQPSSSTLKDDQPRSAEAKSPAPAPLTKKLAKRVTISTEGELLRAFVGRISEENDINVVLDDKMFQAAAEPRVREMSLRNIPLGTALKVVLRTVGLDYKTYKHFIFVSTPTRLRHDPPERLETRFYELKAPMGDSLPKVVLINPAARGQGNFGSITELTRPVNPAMAGEQSTPGQTR